MIQELRPSTLVSCCSTSSLGTDEYQHIRQAFPAQRVDIIIVLRQLSDT